MKERQFIERTRSIGIAVLSTSDLAKITGESGHMLNTTLHRLEKRGVIERLERSKYYFSRTPIEAIASSVINPSYISFLYALSLHKVTTQIPNEVVVVSLKSRSTIELNGYSIRFMKIKKERFFGMTRVRLGGDLHASLATIEKAILDSFAITGHCPITETSYALSMALQTKTIDIDTLISMSKRYGSHVAVKRIGYILEQLGVDLYKDVRTMINKSYDPINPYLPTKGPRSAKWKLIINQEVFDDNK